MNRDIRTGLATTGLASVVALTCLAAAALPAYAAPITVVETTEPAGSGQPQTTVQPSLALNPLIRTQGQFTTLGKVSYFAGNFAPQGWMEANGQELLISQNSALYSLLGTTYGGNGVTTFALPDLRGRTAIGDGQGAGLSSRILGQQVGVENVTLTEANLPSHNHFLPNGDPTTFTGGGQAYTNMQPSLALNYVMPLQGFFPSRDGATPSDPPTLGFVELYAQNFVSSGSSLPYVSADGQILSIAQNPALFSLLGTNYGGNGTSTFALPDLRGRTAIGASAGGNGLSSQVLGQKSGVESVQMSITEMAAHDHELMAPSTDTTTTTGSGQPETNMQPSLAFNYVIAVGGLFPGGDPDSTFLGQVELFAGNFAPSGWMFADGRILPIAQYQALFSLLGTTYGGDGRVSFALPDLRGRIALGDDPNGWRLGERGGVETVSSTLLTLPAHTHDYSVTTDVPEPATLGLFGLGLVGLGIAARRRRAR